MPIKGIKESHKRKLIEKKLTVQKENNQHLIS
jgi:hypothetical protein